MKEKIAKKEIKTGMTGIITKQGREISGQFVFVGTKNILKEPDPRRKKGEKYIEVDLFKEEVKKC